MVQLEIASAKSSIHATSRELVLIDPVRAPHLQGACPGPVAENQAENPLPRRRIENAERTAAPIARGNTLALTYPA